MFSAIFLMTLCELAHTEGVQQHPVYVFDADTFQRNQQVAQFHDRHKEQRFLLRGSLIFSANAMKLLLLRKHRY